MCASLRTMGDAAGPTDCVGVLLSALRPVWSERPDPLGPEDGNRAAPDTPRALSAPALTSAVDGFLRAGVEVPDEHSWNIMYGLVACQDEEVLRGKLLEGERGSGGGDDSEQALESIQACCRQAMDAVVIDVATRPCQAFELADVTVGSLACAPHACRSSMQSIVPGSPAPRASSG